MALLLRKQGIKHIRPLQGGLAAWREKGYPLEGTAATVRLIPIEPALK
ncbi:MAG TPA: rhodanese-like domain-containing protein [Candidatus Acidoferrales bacterium]|nr:rhodanese-like domain-containing protein [Candidatus Acidoferrales bacterium]